MKLFTHKFLFGMTLRVPSINGVGGRVVGATLLISGGWTPIVIRFGVEVSFDPCPFVRRLQGDVPLLLGCR